jgi:fatty-acyl-CoA synthase/long-chain acyl-CoA synthetase
VAPDLLTVHATANPDKTAVIDDRPDGTQTRWTYAELEERSNRLANAMLGLGVAPRDRVIWCGPNSPDVVAMGHAAVFAWVDADQARLLAEIRERCPKLQNVAIFGGPPGAGQLDAEALLDVSSSPPVKPDLEPRTMIYTSGTTGHPKGAVRSGLGDPDQVRALTGFIGYRPDDVYLSTGPLYHSGPGGFMGLAFAFGQTVVLQRKFDAEDWLRLLEKHRVTSTFSAPTPIRLVCNLPDDVKQRYDRSSMRVMIANAAPWSFALKQQYVADFPPESLWEVYGSTELGVDTILRPEDQLRKPGSCGKPAPGVEVVLFDDDGKVVTKPGEPGELYVRSKNVIHTYHKAHDKYEADTRGDHHTVGDVAYFDEDGFYYICDRKKDMIISGGMNIYPAEVEAALDLHADVHDAAVFGIPSEEWGEAVHAVVVVRPGASLDEAAVLAHARAQLASYKIPRSISFAEELPRTGSGKILKRVLREPFWKGHDRRVG